jgi:YfiH family protein
LIEPRPRLFQGLGLWLFENERMLFGYTAAGFTSSALQRLLPQTPLLYLRQVHGDLILGQEDWRPASEADGLILGRPGAAAVIQTADCLPLFFFNDEGSRGGVIHVGWRGLQQGIEERLAARLAGDLANCNFIIGPGIERECYEVGEELPRLFQAKAYAGEIFVPRGGGKYAMDLKLGLTLSLRAAGAAPGRIHDSGLCTYCGNGRFPSYRRDGKTGRRIFNFFMIKSGTGAVVL